jgi:hypothetical protein
MATKAKQPAKTGKMENSEFHELFVKTQRHLLGRKTFSKLCGHRGTKKEVILI